MEHSLHINEWTNGEQNVRCAVCTCGWQSATFPSNGIPFAEVAAGAHQTTAIYLEQPPNVPIPWAHGSEQIAKK